MKHEPLLVLGVDPGCETGMALVRIDGSRPRVLWQMTARSREELHEAVYDTQDEEDEQGYPCQEEEYACHRAVIQTPIFAGKTPRWNRSPISLAKHALTVGYLEGFFKGLGFDVQMVPPKRGAGMKMSPEMFKMIFDFEGRMPSQHARDAANLALQWQEPRKGGV